MFIPVSIKINPHDPCIEGEDPNEEKNNVVDDLSLRLGNDPTALKKEGI